MHDPASVRGDEPSRHLAGDLHGLALAIAPRESRPQLRPSSRSETTYGCPPSAPMSKIARMFGVVELTGGPRLDLEPAHPVGVISKARGQDLHGDVAPGAAHRARNTSPMPPAPSSERIS